MKTQRKSLKVETREIPAVFITLPSFKGDIQLLLLANPNAPNLYHLFRMPDGIEGEVVSAYWDIEGGYWEESRPAPLYRINQDAAPDWNASEINTWEEWEALFQGTSEHDEILCFRESQEFADIPNAQLITTRNLQGDPIMVTGSIKPEQYQNKDLRRQWVWGCMELPVRRMEFSHAGDFIFVGYFD